MHFCEDSSQGDFTPRKDLKISESNDTRHDLLAKRLRINRLLTFEKSATRHEFDTHSTLTRHQFDIKVAHRTTFKRMKA